MTTVTGPSRLLVAAKVEFGDECSADDIERTVRQAGFTARLRNMRYELLPARASR